MRNKKYNGIRLRLGFLENNNRLSLERYPEVMPSIDWQRFESMWSENKDEKSRIRLEIPDLWGTYYIARDIACLSEADPEEKELVDTGIIRVGIILHREDTLYVGHKGGKTEITIGDIFASESHFYHNGQTNGMFVFGVKDVRCCDLPRGQKVRRKFHADIERIRKFSLETAFLNQEIKPIRKRQNN